ncbi:Methyl-CpG DNA binding [Trema orientale]|uniref:Methyl-CpG DNA binding n=1 Tax=Trema orientale TaxID=63057 RepID=A0A2P5A815_TREOI|nr:Methyl-CpG DNA binding [Trema orientale]
MDHQGDTDQSNVRVAGSRTNQVRRRRPRQAGTRCTIHDNTSQGYGWLLPGWITEERHMLSGRVYRYYYDPSPSGRLYYAQNEVIRAWEEKGLILLDN